MTTTTTAKSKKSPATKTLTIAALKRWAPKLRPLVVEMLAKRTFAEVERKRVDTYIAPVFARDESEAAEKRAKESNEDNEYYMMNDTYPVWVRSHPWKAEEMPRRFNVSAEPSVDYYIDEVT